MINALFPGGFRWSVQKDRWLRANRGISFGDISAEILAGNVLDLQKSPSRSDQQVFVVRHRGYVWVVPFVIEQDETIFLKTAYPSRKMLRRYGGFHGKTRKA